MKRLAADRRRRLAHDVGKYIVRAATNVPDTGPVPSVLVDMLMVDLYGHGDGRTARVIFDELVGEPVPEDLLAAYASLLQIDALEAAVRGGDQEALRRTVELAKRVSAILLDGVS